MNHETDTLKRLSDGPLGLKKVRLAAAPAAATMVLLSVLVAGCGAPAPTAGPVRQTPPPVERVDVVQLWALPTAVNFDDEKAADGVQAQVYLFLADQPMPVTVSGKLELVLYDGTVAPDDLAAAKPLHVWSFEGQTLQPRAHYTVYGWCYTFGDLLWGKDHPTHPTVTLTARYSNGGRTIYSMPVTISSKANG